MHLLKISITHTKKRIPLLNFLINCISATSTPQMLFIKDEHTCRFSNFLIIGLCNSLANSWFDICSFLTTNLCRAAKVSERANVGELPEVFYQKLYTIEATPL